MTGSTSNGGGDAAASAPVPDILLSLAKDDRYVSEVFSLLSRAVVPFASIFFSPGRNNRDRSANINFTRRDVNAEETLEDDGKQFIERIRPELDLLATILVYSATFVYYTRNFGGGDGVSNRGVQRSIGMESLNIAFVPEKTRNKVISRNPSLLLRMKELISSKLFQLNAWHRLLLLQTLVPYIINRVGRGGWSHDLNGLVSTLLESCGFRRINNEIATDRSTAQEALDDSAFRNDDMLRGSARRRLFLEQRRRMMNSSFNDNQPSPLFASDDSGGNTSSSLNNVMQQVHISGGESAEPTILTIRWRKLSKLSRNITVRIFHALSSLSHGAHELPRHIGSIESHDNFTKIIKWLLRLHLALFYWNGVYPTISHRIARAKVQDGVIPPSGNIPSTPSSSGAIVANRPSYKPIAALILMQAASALLKAAASVSIDAAHRIQVAFFRWQRRGNHRGSICTNQTESERSEYLELIEERVPGVDSCKEQTKLEKEKGHKSDYHHPCGICLNERIHPAAPSKCGHVFCWNCILHWVMNVREECPLCRTSTRPQDIVPLYNYS